MSLVAVLEEARRRGFLGPGPVERHITHPEAFVAAVDGPPARFLDLGSGAGVPGLVLALRWPGSSVVLVDASAKRTAALSQAIDVLGLADRASVRTARAEDAGREADLRGQFELVTARSFGAPAVTAECGAPFLSVGGLLVVAEPPGGVDDRWPPAGLARLGLADAGVMSAGEATVRRLRQTRLVDERYPRANGVPGKRPLF